MPNPRSILQTFALKAVLLWMICHSSLCLAENATVTGVVNYRGVIPGSTYVWALEANGTKAAEAILPDGNGTYALSLLKGRGYDFKVFVDGSQNGYPTTGEVWKHYTDWNNSLGGYNLTQIDGNISGIDFSLLDQDSDNDDLAPRRFQIQPRWFCSDRKACLRHDRRWVLGVVQGLYLLLE